VHLPRAAVSLALALALGVGVSTAGAAPASPVDTTAVLVGPCTSSVNVPEDYLGLSVEWSMVQHWLGTSRLSAVPATVELLKSLHAGPGGGVLRIGGNSQDGYRWAPGASPDGNQLFTGVVNRGMVDAIFEVARRSGWRIVLGLNLKADQPSEAVGLARYAVEQDRGGNLLALELGNEPNSYFKGDVPGYVARFGRYLDALGSDPVTRLVPISGPALSNQADLAYLHDLESTHGARVRMLTWHHYANRPTLTRLLQEEVITDWTDRIGSVTDAAGLTPTRMDEGNSVGHGGMDRVSNVMGTTAWQVDALLSGAMKGLAGYNVHAWDEHYYPGTGWTARYTPFVVRDRKAIPRPTFYAMALLRGLGGKRLCRAMTANNADGSVKAWTVTDPQSGQVSVYLVNKSQVAHAATAIAVGQPALGGPARISRITDAGGCAGKTTGIDGSSLPADGTFSWPGAPLTANPAGGYDVTLAPCQSALLELGVGNASPGG
jgi:hypothetical protein